MDSALYRGTLRHRRFRAPAHSFEYSLFMVYLDLNELESVFARRWLWSTRRPNVAWFRRTDHYGDPAISLDEAIRGLVSERTGERPEGPIRLLSHLRYMGYCFNPVSFYYCFAKDGETLETIVSEVNNTPWGERHMYVLPEASNVGGANAKRYDFKKAFHVSPFLPMDLDYAWRFGSPGERLWVHMENLRQGERVFEATLSLTREPITGPVLARTLARHPLTTVKVTLGIYFEAMRLWLRRATFYAHPGNRDSEAS